MFSCPEDASFNGRVIYKFTSPANKGYVGKSVAFKTRVSNHRTEAYAKKDGDWVKKTKWKQAIRQFGWDNLRLEILERVPEEVSLDKRERYWIAKLKTKYPNGYNMNKGGGGVIKHTEETKARMSAKADKKPVTSREILESYADGTQLVDFVLYPCAQEAATKTKILRSSISACCNKNRKSAGNRFWHFTKEGDLVGKHEVPSIGDVPMPASQQRKRAVFSEYPDGKKQLHDGMTAAKHNLFQLTGNKFCIGAISKCCNPKYKKTHYKGLKFYYATPQMIAEFEKQNTKKRKRN